MPRPNQRTDRRRELIPIVARAFADRGFRRATTAELAARCGVRENVLYRLWPDKRAMFVAALDHVFRSSRARWTELLADADPEASPAGLILDHEARHLGELGLYRIVFAGLSETDDPEIAKALKSLYGRFQRFIRKQVEAHRAAEGTAASTDADLVAWAIIGLGTTANVGRELGLLSARARKRLLSDVGRALFDA